MLKARTGARLNDERRVRLEQKCKPDEPAAQVHQPCGPSACEGFVLKEPVAPATRGRGSKCPSQAHVALHRQAQLPQVKPRTTWLRCQETIATLEGCRPVLV